MSYLRRRAMSDVDGPITSPTQVDPDLVIATVEPKRVQCAELPADSPWKRPGQVCAPAGGSVVDFFKGLFGRVATATASVPDAPAAPVMPAPSTGPSLLALVVLGGAGYYLLRKKGS